ncbi:MAG: Fe-S cluster assembly scaffold protein NifU [Verrucomicrobiae bacterium]|nr:Fe-S cluster assembly scaffold protein NifU [Verrucomicrobiae bacterium]
MADDKQMTPYTKTVMDHFLNPRNMGDMPDADAEGTVGSAACGDIMKVFLKIQDNRIVEAKFKTFGCGSAIASSSMATEMLKGKTIDEALKMTNRQVVDALGGLPAYKMHCSVLAEDSVKAALHDYLRKHPEAVPAGYVVPSKEEEQAANAQTGHGEH